MYRSLGELASCAGRVFDHFCRLDGSSALDRVACRAALYTLFGYSPSDSLLSALFPDIASPEEEVTEATEEERGACRHPHHPSLVERDAFVRFAQLVAKQEGCIDDPLWGDDGPGSAQTLSRAAGGGGGGACHVGTSWQIFKALAGEEKDYVDWESFCKAAASAGFSGATGGAAGPSLREPSEGETPVLRAFVKGPLEMSSAHYARQRCLLSHVFSLLDADHDGRLQFSDVKPYLQAK